MPSRQPSKDAIAVTFDSGMSPAAGTMITLLAIIMFDDRGVDNDGYVCHGKETLCLVIELLKDAQNGEKKRYCRIGTASISTELLMNRGKVEKLCLV
jgi:hypothetical protein